MEEAAMIQAEEKKFRAGEELRTRLLEAASRLFGERGYANVSVRNISDAVGCSQMAMYRHFPDKDALLRHLCNEFYRNFTIRLHEKYGNLTDPKEKLWLSLRDLVVLSQENPHHYRLVFLEPERSEQAKQERVELARLSLSYFHRVLKESLPEEWTDAMVSARLRQMLATLHGLTAMLLTHPEAYGLTLEKALQDLDSAFAICLRVPWDDAEGIVHEAAKTGEKRVKKNSTTARRKA